MDYSNSAPATPFTCPTFLGQSDSLEEVVTVTNVAGNAKINAGGSSKVCVYIGSDDTVYEQQVGSGTI